MHCTILIFGGLSPCLLRSVVLHESSVILGVKTHLVPTKIVENAPKSVGEGGAYCVLSIYLFTITPLMGQMRLFCMPGSVFLASCSGLLLCSGARRLLMGHGVGRDRGHVSDVLLWV